MKDILDHVKDFSEYQLTKQVPQQFHDVKKHFSKRLEEQDHELKHMLKELQMKTLEELIP